VGYRQQRVTESHNSNTSKSTNPDTFAMEYYALCLAGIVNFENISENCLSVTFYQTTDSVYQNPKFYCHKY